MKKGSNTMLPELVVGVVASNINESPAQKQSIMLTITEDAPSGMVTKKDSQAAEPVGPK